MATLRIVNGTLINEGQRLEADIQIRNGRIDAIAADLGDRPADRVIDASGMLILPGMIDDQVHFREPGLERKGDLASESRAAVAGGITSFMDMPNTDPATLDNDALRDKHARARGTSFANWAFYLGASNDNLEAIKAVDPTLACGVKVFIGASPGSMLVEDTNVLEAIFASSPLLVATHCEDSPTIAANYERLTGDLEGNCPPELHVEIRSREACLKSLILAVELARRHGTRLHVLHLTTADELALFEPGPIERKQITAEVCVHHLFFDASHYARQGALIKCHPAIKQASDRLALLAAVNEDRIDIIATDHAPHTVDEKALPFLQAPAGLPLVQHALLTLLEHWHDDVFTLERIVQKTAHAPALRFGIKERGFLREGYHADLVIVDPNTTTAVREQTLLSRCGWSPFEDVRFRSRIRSTIVNGVIAWDNDRLAADSSAMALEFHRG